MTLRIGSVIVRYQSDEDCRYYSGQGRIEHVEVSESEQPYRGKVEAAHGQNSCHYKTPSEWLERVFSSTSEDEEHPNYGRQQAKCSRDEREQHPTYHVVACYCGSKGREASTEDHCPYVLARDRLEKIRTPPGNVTHIIPNEISNNSWVSRVIFWYSFLDLAHEICTHVGRFSVNPSSELSEERRKTCAESKSYNKGWRNVRALTEYGSEEKVQSRDSKKAHGDNCEAEDHSTSESHLQRRIETGRGCLSCPNVRPYRNVHCNISSQA